MSKAERADWAAQVPWKGIQDKPALIEALALLNPAEMASLIAIISSLPDNASLAKVALTGKYSDLIDKPMFGTAAFADISSIQASALAAAALLFQSLPTAETLQIGSIPFVATQQKYSVVFTETMAGIPRIQTQVFMADDLGEKLFATITDDSITEDGFDFWLNAIPALSTGRLEYRAVVETQP